MNEEFEGNLVKLIGFGKGERLADKTPQALVEGVIPAFNVIGESCLFTHRKVHRREFTKDLLIGSPKITKSDTRAITLRQPRPQVQTTFSTAIPAPIGDDLARAPT